MKAEIITIGDELLLGQVIDTNSAWLGQQLNMLGINVHFRMSLPDDKQAILTGLSAALQRSNIIIITGGLGPTKDDITKLTLCEFFGTSLVKNEKVATWVSDIFKMRNLPMIESNLQQAMLPENCDALWNRNGTAPGMWFNHKGRVFVSLPGVPFEMKSIFEEEVIPKLKETFSFPVIIHRTLQTCSIGESFLARKIAPLEDKLPSHIKLAYLPSVGAVRLRFSAYGQDETSLAQEVNELVQQCYDLVGEYIFGEADDSLQQVVGVLLKSKAATISTAESCTGGYVSHLLTSVPGSSAYYNGSIIAYSNEIKKELLHVPEEILTIHGAVSEACVRAMAENCRQVMHTDYAIATSGIAGPDGGTPEKPVGMVWIAIATPTETIAKMYQMGDNRERTIQRTALMGLDLLRLSLLQTTNASGTAE